MSASTVSITASPAAARRRAVVAGEKKSGLDLLVTEGVAASPAATGGEIGKDLSHSIRGGETVLERSVQVKKALPPNSTTVLPRRTTRKGASKPEKPRWQTVLRVFTKNFLLLLVLLGFVQMIRWWMLNSGPTVPHSSDYEGRIAEMESFLKTTTNMMQIQVDAVDRKIEKGIVDLRQELGKKIEDNGVEIATELQNLDRRTESLEKSLSDLSATDWLAKVDFDSFVEDFKKAKGLGSGDGDPSLDEIRDFARNIVQKEIEKHAADGLGMVDFALASGGAMVVKHSEPYYISGRGSGWFSGTNRNVVHSEAVRMLRPSFGEPGQCFPLKGSSGFVQIRLRMAIIPEAITLEHVAKSVAYDRSSAPKDCRVSGWFRGQSTTDVAVETEMYFLTEFTYDLEKSNAQTFNVLDSAAGSGTVDTIRLDFSSNHGSPSHTCIYRLRVHGREPNSLSALEM